MNVWKKKLSSFKRMDATYPIHVTEPQPFGPSHSSTTTRQVARKFSLQLPALPVPKLSSAKGGPKMQF